MISRLQDLLAAHEQLLFIMIHSQMLSVDQPLAAWEGEDVRLAVTFDPIELGMTMQHCATIHYFPTLLLYLTYTTYLSSRLPIFGFTHSHFGPLLRTTLLSPSSPYILSSSPNWTSHLLTSHLF